MNAQPFKVTIFSGLGKTITVKMSNKKTVIKGVSLNRVANKMGISRAALSQKMNKMLIGVTVMTFSKEELEQFVEACKKVAAEFEKDVEGFAENYFDDKEK